MASMREQLAARRASLEEGTAKPTEEFALSESEDAALDEEVDDTPEPTEEEPAEGEMTPAEEELDKVVVETNSDVAVEAIATPGQFKPEFKYRADGKDMEVPEYLRPFIKDKETQEKVVKMLEKHDAFDTVSTRRDQFRMELDTERQDKQRYIGAIDNMRQTVIRGDIDGFLKLTDIPEEMMLKWATEKAKYYMGDENYRQHIDQQTRQRQDSWQKETQVNDYQAKYQELEVRQLQSEFNYEMMKPEVSSFSTSFDKLACKPGAFIEEVKNRGELAYLRERKTISPGEVIQGMMKQFGSITQVAQQPRAAAANPAASKVIVKTASKVATIPTVKGSSASPAKEEFTSLDAIRKYRKETYGK